MEFKTTKPEVKSLLLRHLDLKIINNKKISLGFNKIDLKYMLDFGYIEGWNFKELREYALKILDSLDTAKIEDLEFIKDNSAICPYCFSLKLKAISEPDINNLNILCAECGEEIF